MLKWALPLGIMSWIFVGSLVLLALYEWKWLLAGGLVALVFLIRGMARHRVPSPPLANDRKEDLS